MTNSNKFLEELIKLNKELEAMTDEEKMAMLEGYEPKPGDAEDWAVLENFIVNSGSRRKDD